MKVLLIGAVLVSLTGCLSTAGTADYTIEPVEAVNGEMVCCKATIYNSKDYENLKFVLKKSKEGEIEATLEETGVSASDPAAVNAQNQQKLLDIITNVIPKKE